MDYAAVEDLKTFGRQPDALSDAGWQILATAASRFFDTVTEVVPDFYASDSVTEPRSFIGDGSSLLAIDPVPNRFAIQVVAIEDGEYPVPEFAYAVDPDDGSGSITLGTFLETLDGSVWLSGIRVYVDATWSAAQVAVPSDVNYAVIEIALHAWRKGDPSFANISQAENSVLLASLPPTAKATVDKYKAMYSNRCLFA